MEGQFNRRLAVEGKQTQKNKAPSRKRKQRIAAKFPDIDADQRLITTMLTSKRG